MATNIPIGEPSHCIIGDPPPWRVGDYPYPPWGPTYPEPIPYVPYPPVYPTIKTITTTGGDLLGISKRDRRIKELEALLEMAHEELLSGDDDALAACELIEDCLDKE